MQILGLHDRVDEVVDRPVDGEARVEAEQPGAVLGVGQLDLQPASRRRSVVLVDDRSQLKLNPNDAAPVKAGPAGGS